MQSQELLTLLLILVSVLTTLLATDGTIRMVVRRRHRSVADHPSLIAPIAVALVTGGAGAVAPLPVVSVPVSTLVSPAVAAAVLRTIINMRRDQRSLGHGEVPSRLSEENLRTVAELMEIAATSREWSAVELPPSQQLPHEVKKLLDEVGETETCHTGPFPESWLVMVRVLGEPVAVNHDDERAVFSKRRSLELLTWMALNRDRSTRSSARNALWEVSVADSTFATVLSDMRRGLARVAPLPEDECWSPVTYTDDLPLAGHLITDVDALWSAVHSRGREDLLGALSLVRDFPFAGTAWLWPDLDGSTTRAVIGVLSAVRSVLESSEGDLGPEERSRVVRAGLLVSPGDEELIDRFKALGRTVGVCATGDSGSLS
jgi:hypothetical protein